MDVPKSASAPLSEAIATDAAEPRVSVYVWDLPVRITHWVNVLSILVLSVTGYYIANPFVTTTGPAADQFLMGSIRFVHFSVAFVFTMSVLFRVYWAFAGSTYARWNQFVPATSGRLRALGKMLRYYTFTRPEPPKEVGHNPLAGFTYIGLYVLFILQIVTGFALYSQSFTGGVWKALFGWIIVAFGAQPVRLVHDIIMYLIIAFTIHHVYSSIVIDMEERSGLVSSIVTGWKSFTRSYLNEASLEDRRSARGLARRRARRGDA